MNFLKNKLCYIYIALWLLYKLQEMFMLRGIVAQLILGVLIIMSFYAFYEVNLNYKTGPYIKCLNVLLSVLTIYGIVYVIGSNTYHMGSFADDKLSSYTYLQGLYISVLPIYAFYYFTLRRLITTQNLIIFFFIILFYNILMYYQWYWSVNSQTSIDGMVNNTGFLFVPLIPMLQMVKMRDLWKYSLLIMIYAFIIMSMKRGAILTGTVMLFLFMTRQIRVTSSKRLFSIIGLSVVAISFISWQLIDLYLSNSYFQNRFVLTLEGYSSNRDNLYTFFFDYFVNKTSWMEFLFGLGANGTIKLYGQYAHNDWLEFAINQGIFGLILYMIYWLAFAFEWKNYKGNKENKRVLGDIIIAYLLIALFSMSFENMPLGATLCIGYCLAMNYAGKRLKQPGDDIIGSYLHPIK